MQRPTRTASNKRWPRHRSLRPPRRRPRRARWRSSSRRIASAPSSPPACGSGWIGPSNESGEHVTTGTVVHVTGARPNFPKAAPVIAALRARGVRQQLVHTGQHYDDALSEIFFRELSLPRPDVNLGVGSGSHATQTAAVMVALEERFLAERPALVLVYGDVNSTVAAALV